jgi:spermidine/putrescine transport system ATP-binding protein
VSGGPFAECAGVTAAPAGTVPAIELAGVTKRYGETVALDNVDLRIEAGEFFCLLGPSGCGKTTTLNIIGGFIPLSTGHLRIEGKVVNDLPPHKRNVNTVFQNYALFPHMTVHDNVAFGLKMAGQKGDAVDRKVRSFLALVGLESFGGRMPGQLSGGQAQRVALARALVKEPAVLLLDEPLGALDLKLRKQMQVELARIHRQVRTTFVFVTHDQEEALSMATTVAVMSQGRVAQLGAPRDIYYRPVSRFVADFIGESNFLSGTGDAPSGGVGGTLRLDDGTVLPGPDDLVAGPATLMVRPESLHVATERPTGGDVAALGGKVIGVSFLGAYTRLTVETAAGRIVAAPPNVEGARSAARSDLLDRDVWVWWVPSDAVVVGQD